jgi:heat shock protein HslJ
MVKPCRAAAVRYSEPVMRAAGVTLTLVLLMGCVTQSGAERMRGEYTFGHEVNSFCPEINSQCYWLGPGTSQAMREQLKALYRAKKPGLYESVCIVIDGAIDRDSPRSGFAADYDGLIDIGALLGDCNSGPQVVPGDLNHRRWVLAERDGAPVDVDAQPVVLDFGERLFVEGLDGCQRFSGFATLDSNAIILDNVNFERSQCSDVGLAATLFTSQDAWKVRFEGQALHLASREHRLAFERDDWK